MTSTTERTFKIAVNSGKDELIVTKSAAGKYAVIGFTGMKPDHDAFGFDLDSCAASAENLDFSSDFYDCFRTSLSVKVGECTFGVDTIEGPTLGALREAAKALVVCSVDSQDV